MNEGWGGRKHAGSDTRVQKSHTRPRPQILTDIGALIDRSHCEPSSSSSGAASSSYFMI